MQALVNDTSGIHVTDDTPNAEVHYRARFHFDPNAITMASGEAHFIFQGFSGTTNFPPFVLRVEFRNSSGAYQIRAALLDDASTWTNTAWFTISDASHSIEVDWQAATAVGANNGALTYWVDGITRGILTGIDNDTRRIDRARLGALTSLDAGTSGTYFFDAFESRRQSYIGPASGVAVAAAEPINTSELYAQILEPDVQEEGPGAEPQLYLPFLNH
jgi:hypothetical protein